jgi:FtsH-binding integral membrane protein
VGLYDQRDLTGWSSFLLMGLIGVVAASIVNLFASCVLTVHVSGPSGNE